MESPPRPSAPREFILENQLGSGAFSQVWLAQHVSLRKKVAIKVISKQSVRTPKGHSRFIRETEIQKRVHHPYIASLFYVSENILHHYLVMEYVNGITLQNRISNSGHISEFEAQHYFLQIFSAISYLHEKLKVIHRDLKADNIMIDQNNNIRLIDFGFACDIDDDEELRKCCGSPSMKTCFLFFFFFPPSQPKIL
ncbi:CAMK family protein kinase [Tritrichomonas foetus]|uniref:CAMK family protein kinase n=1 Tax=Tritrichomonas foetus TaxID=1144522 RepID=A0A1J4JES3_9EUKA|nr:CAMK family protein kinase [Tritrichomonas foetus]|eukprot:OHS97608.1 CAMK family protein kinase [Tritrichomonas foetus]